ncbi:MAG: pyridoxamine 5'-phosphate oxidase [Phycisphaeraceae bacterium]|nr:pyridoxamine 5'-phosphate oxidase [Phycisphaeraceae bacterium]
MVDPAHPDPLSGACRFADQELPDPLPAEPIGLVRRWLDDAARGKVQPNPNAMTLATVGPDGRPSARIVLCRTIHPDLGCFVFYTNYRGAKGRALEHSGRAALVFHWDDLDRQVRIEGPVTRSPASESDGYFRSRPVMSRVAAWASEQSAPIASRSALLEQNARVEARFGIERGPDGSPRLKSGAPLESLDVPRPGHWGGFRVWAETVELWLGHTNRLHDRAVWRRDLSPATVDGEPGFSGGPWRAGRLQP